MYEVTEMVVISVHSLTATRRMQETKKNHRSSHVYYQRWERSLVTTRDLDTVQGPRVKVTELDCYFFCIP